MASAKKNLSTYNKKNMPSAKGISFGIVVSEWNASVTHALYEGCYNTLLKHGAKEDQIYTIQVPGSFELPVGAKMLLSRHNLNAVICIGCVIQGETKHNDYINNAVATGLTTLGVVSGKPVIFGVLTPNTEEQALERAGGKYGNKGVEAAATAIRMAAIGQDLKQAKKSIGF